TEHSYQVSNHQTPDLPNPYLPPPNQTQKPISQLCHHFMRIQQLPIHHNFFHLPPTSLHILQLTNPLNQPLQTNEPLLTFFTYPSLPHLAKYIHPSQHSKEQPIEQELP
ncbi:hypothetical protein, partial [Bacillus pumilus]|uniref:hypothetical protein n=1 Tax=Bacillus pumilus TaxID=1408 RepID=UPI001C92FE72